MKKYFLLSLCLITLTLIGCNTIEGIGEDLSNLGGAISDSSERHQ